MRGKSAVWYTISTTPPTDSAAPMSSAVKPSPPSCAPRREQLSAARSGGGTRCEERHRPWGREMKAVVRRGGGPRSVTGQQALGGGGWGLGAAPGLLSCRRPETSHRR